MIKPYLTVYNLTDKEIGLNVQGLRKVYKSRLALMDFNISVTRGEVVSLLGPNGAGKTTAFNIIAGIHKSDGGSIKLDGMKYQTFLCTEGRKQVWDTFLKNRQFLKA